MAGLIARLFGGRSRPPDPDPLPGAAGYRMPRGPVGEGGYPGSTSVRRTFPGRNPRLAKIRADSDTGWEGGLGTTKDTRQAAYRGDVPNAALDGPRSTGRVVTPQGRLRQNLQTNSPDEFFGGPMLGTGPGNQTAGGNPLSGAAHSVRDTETPATRRQPVIGAGTPGAQNVRNGVAQRYKNAPGQAHTYKSAPRGDLPPVNRTGQASDGNVHPDAAVTEVTVQNRFVFPGGGNQTWSVERQMPYTGRGNGARGADLNGQRYYGEFQGQDQFANAGMGDYGISRSRGRKRPVSFTEPAPWTANFYDTTSDVGTTDAPGTPTQSPDLVHVSPQAGRASNNTGRRG